MINRLTQFATLECTYPKAQHERSPLSPAASLHVALTHHTYPRKQNTNESVLEHYHLRYEGIYDRKDYCLECTQLQILQNKAHDFKLLDKIWSSNVYPTSLWFLSPR